MKRKKLKPLGWYKKKLWLVFSKYIKARDRGICFTCGSKVQGANAHCGHFIKASICGIFLYFNEDNNHLQCARCNLWLDGNQYAYGIKLGAEKVKELYKIRLENKNKTWDRYMFEDRIAYYKAELAK